MARKIKLKQISLMVQAAFLSRLYPESKVSVVRSKLEWRGLLKPSPLSREYELYLRYSLNGPPEIFVVHPDLTKNERGILPHVYSVKEQKLCLHFPPEGCWRADKIIAKLLIPWASEWLYFYEVWVETGDWVGGGTHKEDKNYKDIHYIG